MPSKNYWRRAIEIKTRKATPSDIPAVFQIQVEEIQNPCEIAQLTHEFSLDISCFYVAEAVDSREIAGFIIFWVLGDTIELHDIAVKRAYKRLGIGGKLLDCLMQTADRRQVKEIFLEVRESNQGAIHFYEKHDFKKISTRKSYYSHPVEDAFIYALYSPNGSNSVLPLDNLNC
jgi:ribosomal-protein-alanine N-acetyltransferase